ncbi:IS5 family transposase [Streptomyces sp. NPDC014820]
MSLGGRKRRDDRRVLNGIVRKFRTGTAWRDVPERYGPWATLHTRFRRWAADGTFERMLRAAQAKADVAGDIEWLVSVDSTIVRAHQQAAGARKRGPAPGPRPVQRRSDQQDSSGLRRPGPTARLRRHGRQTNDCTRFTTVMEAIWLPRLGPGRPRTRPDHVLGDKGYSSKAIRAWLRRHGIPHTIPERTDQARDRARRGSRGGRPPTSTARSTNTARSWSGASTA